MTCFVYNDENKEVIKTFFKKEITKLEALVAPNQTGVPKGGTPPSVQTFSLSETNGQTQICQVAINFGNNMHQFMDVMRKHSPETFFKIIASTYNVNKYFWDQVKSDKVLKDKLIRFKLAELNAKETQKGTWVLDFDTNILNDEDVHQIQFRLRQHNKYIFIGSGDGEGGSFDNYYYIDNNNTIHFANEEGDILDKVDDEEVYVSEDVNAILTQCHDIIQSVSSKVDELVPKKGASLLFALQRKYSLKLI